MVGFAPTAAADTSSRAAGPLAGLWSRVEEIPDLFSIGDIAFTALVFLATLVLVRLVSPAAWALAARLRRRRPAVLRLVPLARTALWALAAYAVAGALFGPPPQPSLALAVAAAFGLAFGARDVLRNLFGGLVIALDGRFQHGDLVEVAGYRGEVVAVGALATSIRATDGAIVTVPNAEAVSRPVRNATAGGPGCAVVVELFLPARADLTRLKRICREAAATSPCVDACRPISVRIEDAFLGAHLTKARIQAYVYDHRLEAELAADIVERAKRAFTSEGLLPAEPAPAPDAPDAPWRASPVGAAAGGTRMAAGAVERVAAGGATAPGTLGGGA